MLSGKYTKEYDWGTVEIVIADYSFGLRQLTVTALPARGRKLMKYDYLIKVEP